MEHKSDSFYSGALHLKLSLYRFTHRSNYIVELGMERFYFISVIWLIFKDASLTHAKNTSILTNVAENKRIVEKSKKKEFFPRQEKFFR